MNKVILYLLLTSYSITMVKPVMPYISDKIAHVFWRYEHISTVHFENGKYHAHYEALEASKKSEPEKATNTNKPETFSNEHFSPNDFYTFFWQPVNINPLPATYLSVYNTYLPTNFLPPKCLVFFAY